MFSLQILQTSIKKNCFYLKIIFFSILNLFFKKGIKIRKICFFRWCFVLYASFHSNLQRKSNFFLFICLFDFKIQFYFSFLKGGKYEGMADGEVKLDKAALAKPTPSAIAAKVYLFLSKNQCLFNFF